MVHSVRSLSIHSREHTFFFVRLHWNFVISRETGLQIEKYICFMTSEVSERSAGRSDCFRFAATRFDNRETCAAAARTKASPAGRSNNPFNRTGCPRNFEFFAKRDATRVEYVDGFALEEKVSAPEISVRLWGASYLPTKLPSLG